MRSYPGMGKEMGREGKFELFPFYNFHLSHICPHSYYSPYSSEKIPLCRKHRIHVQVLGPWPPPMSRTYGMRV